MTLKHLSAVLEVSPATISRALHRPELVSRATRERVLAAVEHFAYRPNQVGRALRTQRTQALGIIVSDILNPFYSALTKAVEGVAAGRQHSLIICNSDENPAAEAAAFRLLAEMGVAGIIHASSGAPLRVLEQVRSRGVILVDVDRESGLGAVDTVLVDNALGAAMATEHLLGLGHRRVATIAGPQHLTTGRDRLTGFLSSMARAGCAVPPEYVQMGDFRKASGHVATMRLLGLQEPPTALFVANNEMVAGALTAIRSHGLKLPDDLSLVAFDDFRCAEYMDPPLTVVAQPVEEMGALAAEMLFNRIGGDVDAMRHVLKPHLIVRGTTGRVASGTSATNR